MERREDDLQGDGRSDAGRGACTSDGEQVNWLGMGVRGMGQAASPDHSKGAGVAESLRWLNVEQINRNLCRIRSSNGLSLIKRGEGKQ
jgi:hypothetical protein